MGAHDNMDGGSSPVDGLNEQVVCPYDVTPEVLNAVNSVRNPLRG
jgi:hypothetical protein